MEKVGKALQHIKREPGPAQLCSWMEEEWVLQNKWMVAALELVLEMEPLELVLKTFSFTLSLKFPSLQLQTIIHSFFQITKNNLPEYKPFTWKKKGIIWFLVVISNPSCTWALINLIP